MKKNYEEILKKLYEYYPNFKEWYKQNQSKINKKISNLQKEEDKLDVLFELKCAAIFNEADNIQCVYEPLNAKQKGPDFLLELDNDINSKIHLECKRIRPNNVEKSMYKLINEFKDKINKQKIDKLISLNIEIEDLLDNLKQLEKIYEDLLNRVDEIIAYITETIKENNNVEIIPLNNYCKGLSASISNKKNGTKINYSSSIYDIHISGKEPYKFWDKIFECKHIEQLVEKEKNIFALYLDNDAYDWQDFCFEINKIKRLINESENDFFKRKGYRDANDFIKKSSIISAIILIRRDLSGELFLNKRAHKCLTENDINIVDSVMKVRKKFPYVF